MADLRESGRFDWQDAGTPTGGTGHDDDNILELDCEVDSPDSVTDETGALAEIKGHQAVSLAAPSKWQSDELLLDQEFDPIDEPRLAIRAAGNPFVLVSLPGAGHGLRPDFARDRQSRLTAVQVLAPKGAGTGLAELLDNARALALAASASEGRSRLALYNAIERAHDLALAAKDSPDELTSLLVSANIATNRKVPSMGIVKLVFGSDYDKTRLSEYAAALSYAQRIKLGHGALAKFLSSASGSLRGVVAEERRLRRIETGANKPERTGPSDTLARRLRAMALRPLGAVAAVGDEFLLVLARRLPDGTAVMIGEVPRDIPLLERAARRFADTKD
ncbi:MAG: hypothetical protein ACKOQM_08830 [Novosphingobium sp.]